jgi:hypothetical protein
MKIKTSELTGAALDWAVAKCEDESVVFDGRVMRFAESQFSDEGWFKPSEDWAQGGPIIERLMLTQGLVLRCWVEKGRCEASLDFPHRFSYGPTPLIAAMRCFVASTLGDEVDIPEELL